MYDELYEAWKREKETLEIQALASDFYARLTDYVKRIREENRMLDEKTLRAKLMYREQQNVEKMVKELVQLRYEKALTKTMAEKTVPKEVLTAEEEKLYGEISPLAKSYHTLLESMLRGRLSRIERNGKPKQVLVRFLQPIPAIIGSDMKTYGPFNSEDVATLPSENARILIKQGVAVEVETK